MWILQIASKYILKNIAILINLEFSNCVNRHKSSNDSKSNTHLVTKSGFVQSILNQLRHYKKNIKTEGLDKYS